VIQVYEFGFDLRWSRAPRHGPTVRTYGVAVSYKRGTPVGVGCHLIWSSATAGAGSGCCPPACSRAWFTVFRFGVQGFGFQVQGLGIRVKSLGFGIRGLGFRVSGSKDDPGTAFEGRGVAYATSTFF